MVVGIPILLMKKKKKYDKEDKKEDKKKDNIFPGGKTDLKIDKDPESFDWTKLLIAGLLGLSAAGVTCAGLKRYCDKSKSWFCQKASVACKWGTLGMGGWKIIDEEEEKNKTLKRFSVSKEKILLRLKRMRPNITEKEIQKIFDKIKKRNINII